MRRCLLFVVLLASVAGCRLPPEREVLRPLAENGGRLAFLDMLTRARAQASAALEAFYIDNWAELDEAGRALEQTARFLPQSAEQPTQLRDDIPQAAKHLRQEALRLSEAARAKDVQTANQAIQRITLQVRLLSPK